MLLSSAPHRNLPCWPANVSMDLKSTQRNTDVVHLLSESASNVRLKRSRMSCLSYQPLGGAHEEYIRLLTLLPGSNGEEIRCFLRKVKLREAADNKSYETLSYTWGDEEPDKHIYLRTEDGGDVRFAVRTNLLQALRAFRHPEELRNLWIDAICINQQDDDEKAGQIPLMRRIYEGSMQTLVWLGEGTVESRPAMNLARALHNAWIICDGNVPKIGALNSSQLKQHGLPSVLSKDYVKLLTMLEQPWFSRAWIVQEVTVSKKSVVYWGDQSMEFPQLVLAIDFALRAELPFAMHPAVNRFLPLAVEAATYQQGNCTLLSALLRHRPCAAKEPMDKVYAFLGLTERGEGNYVEIKVDYKQDLASCYIDVARAIAAHDHSLDILSVASTPFTSAIDGLPSWVPDWSPAMGARLRHVLNAETTSMANAENAGKRKAPKFTAAGSSIYRPMDGLSMNELSVEGHLFDTIIAVEARYESVHIPSSTLDSVAEVVKLASEVGKTVSSFFQAKSVIMQWEDSIGLANLSPDALRYPNGEDLIDAFWQTLMVGNIAPTEDKAQLRQEYLALLRLQRPLPAPNRFNLGFVQTAIASAKAAALSAVTKDAPTRFQKRCQDIIFRRFVRTSRGYMGVCSGDVKTGDQIWLCKGSKVPLVFRSVGSGGKWIFIGDAYIHGIMYGVGFAEGHCEKIFLC